MAQDIRDQSYISHEDIIGLNFIRKPGAFVFRKYYKQGLRSQIMEVLDPNDLQKQNKGEFRNGILYFPWAKPIKMLRIFRTKFNSLKEAFDEIKKFKIVEQYLPPDAYAQSIEFIVDYIRNGERDFILCGLQEYVDGNILNPWDLNQINHLEELFANLEFDGTEAATMTTQQRISTLRQNAEQFIDSVKKMILEAQYVPDLAGVENLILTTGGNIKLVDINNISKVSFGPAISLDDKGYPVSDKSIEAISILEEKLLDRALDKTDPLYRMFLTSHRMKEVRALEEAFHLSIKLRVP